MERRRYIDEVVAVSVARCRLWYRWRSGTSWDWWEIERYTWSPYFVFRQTQCCRLANRMDSLSSSSQTRADKHVMHSVNSWCGRVLMQTSSSMSSTRRRLWRRRRASAVLTLYRLHCTDAVLCSEDISYRWMVGVLKYGDEPPPGRMDERYVTSLQRDPVIIGSTTNMRLYSMYNCHYK